MIRILCSTNECITQARQLEAARLRLAAAEAQATRLAAERDAMADMAEGGRHLPLNMQLLIFAGLFIGFGWRGAIARAA